MPPSPASASPILVMKFGGTSVAGARGLRSIAQLAQAALQQQQVLLVASAMAGVTDLLVSAAERGTDPQAILARYRSIHRDALAELAPELGTSAVQALEARLDALQAELARLLEGLGLLGDCSPKVFARLCSLGERTSCAMLAGVLEAKGMPCLSLDPTEVMACEGDPLEARPLPAKIREALAGFREGQAPLALVPGFIGGDANGDPVLLGRGGSDLSAALLAEAVDAAVLEIWTDVDGVFTADPRLVKQAQCIGSLSYEEAMELAHFGAKVLHPRTLAPVRGQAIPVYVRNSFRPEHPGTLVCAHPTERVGARGLSLLKGTALLDLSGPGLRGVPGVAARAFGALAAKAINVILITQGSSECAITICVRATDAAGARDALGEAFEMELAAGLMDPLVVRQDLAVLSVVGDGMLHFTGIAGTFFGALADAGCSVVAIAQGSSERSISAVITEADAAAAIVAVHHRFFEAPAPLEIYLLGVGLVGRQFLTQLQKLQERHPDEAARLRLCGVANSRCLLLKDQGLDPAQALAQLDAEGVPLDLRVLAGFAQGRSAPAVVVDCTTSQAVTDAYPAFVEAGFHLVSASKKANSGPMDSYRALRRLLAERKRKFRFETNVGAGLPIIAPLQDLRNGGDHVLKLEGILSGSLSFLFGRLEAGAPLSDAVREAREKGFTEPDPREDLCGLDVARKALILHRELGGTLELDQVDVEGALPQDFDSTGDVDAFMNRLNALDARFRAQSAALQAEGKVLRYVATITPQACKVAPLAVPKGHPLAVIQDGENALCFFTEAYDPHPMVVRGYGAGAAVTAAGVLADVIRVASEVRP